MFFRSIWQTLNLVQVMFYLYVLTNIAFRRFPLSNCDENLRQSGPGSYLPPDPTLYMKDNLCKIYISSYLSPRLIYLFGIDTSTVDPTLQMNFQ